MKPLFLTVIEIETLTPPRALTRLAREGIAVYDAEKTGVGKVRLRVKSKDLRKIFAIFSRSCYTVNIIGPARLSKAAEFVRKRAALVAAAAVCAALVAASNLFVLRVRFIGSGSHYADEAMPLLAEAGVRVFAPFSRENADKAERAVSSLPSVSFCSVEKEGFCVTVTVEVSAELPVKEMDREFICPADGIVESLTVIRGTALAGEGDAVAKGQTLVTGRVAVGEGENAAYRGTYPVAFLSLLRSFEYEYACAEAGPSEEERALAGAMLRAEGEIVNVAVTLLQDGTGYIYRVAVGYRQTYSVGCG